MARPGDRPWEWRTIALVVVTAMGLRHEQRQRLDPRVERILQKGAYTREELIALVRDRVRGCADDRDNGE